MRRPGSAALLRPAALLVVALGAGCGHGLLQTARTVSAGSVQMTWGGGVMVNEHTSERDPSPGMAPQHLQLSYGVSDQLEVDGRLLLFPGVMAGVKYNLLPRRSPLALSVLGGLGTALNLQSGGDGLETAGWLLHVPLTVMASYTLWRRLTPYVGLGYGFYWIFDREPEDLDPRERYADRAGHGDGALTITGGFELAVTRSFAVLAEYQYFRPVVDDPGDFYAFVDNHIIQLGFRY